MRILALAAALSIAACASSGVKEIETHEVVVTRTERAVSEEQVRETVPPAPLSPRPADVSSALDVAIAKLCEWVGYGEKADLLLQHAAGISPAQRVVEPVCRAGAAGDEDEGRRP